MNPLRTVTGKAAVLDRADVDTDQIIPKQFLKRIERTGFGEFLFFDWAKDPDFELNRPESQGARILLTGRADGDAAIRAVNVGQVYRFLTKPCRSSELLTVLHFACENFEIDAENRRLLALVRQQADLLGEIERRAPDTVSLARAAVS